MSLTEISLNIPTEHVANVFGQLDAYIKKIERTLNVTVVVRGAVSYTHLDVYKRQDFVPCG